MLAVRRMPPDPTGSHLRDTCRSALGQPIRWCPTGRRTTTNSNGACWCAAHGEPSTFCSAEARSTRTTWSWRERDEAAGGASPGLAVGAGGDVGRSRSFAALAASWWCLTLVQRVAPVALS